MTKSEMKKIRARSLINAKLELGINSDIARKRTLLRNKIVPSVMKKTGPINDMAINDVINTNNPNSPVTRTRVIGE